MSETVGATGRGAPLLFVYGTLMRGFDNPMARRLRAEAAFVGPASCVGRLYLVAEYPGLVTSADPSERVHGELFRLVDPGQDLLAALDDYEGCGPGPRLSARPVAPGGCILWRSIQAWSHQPILPSGFMASCSG